MIPPVHPPRARHHCSHTPCGVRRLQPVVCGEADSEADGRRLAQLVQARLIARPPEHAAARMVLPVHLPRAPLSVLSSCTLLVGCHGQLRRHGIGALEGHGDGRVASAGMFTRPPEHTTRRVRTRGCDSTRHPLHALI